MSDGVNIVGRHSYEKYEKKVKEVNQTVDSKSFYISYFYFVGCLKKKW